MVIDHIGIAVENLKKMVTLYAQLLGHTPEHFEDVDDQKVRTAFFSVGPQAGLPDGGVAPNIELLEATSSESPIAKFIVKNGRGGVHHVCFKVKDIKIKLNELKNQGFTLIDQTPRVGAHGKLVAFIHPKSTGGVLIELSEKI